MRTRRFVIAFLFAALAVALAAPAALWTETATLDAGNGYCWEKRFKTQGPVALHVALTPADAPVDAFLYGKDDAVVAKASGSGSLSLTAPSAASYTLALVGGRKTAVSATVTAEAK